MDESRARGVLTEADRDFLKSDGSGYSHQQKYDRKKAIKQRTRDAILDFKILFDHLPEDEAEEIFGDDPSTGELGEGLASMLGLVYRETWPHGRFKNLLLRGVQQAEDFPVTTKFEVEPIQEAAFESAIGKFRRSQLKNMTDAERKAIIYLMRRSSTIGPGELDEARREMVERWEQTRSTLSEARSERARSRAEKQQRKESSGDG